MPTDTPKLMATAPKVGVAEKVAPPPIWAVSMEPNNPLYLQTLNEIENGGAAYRRTAGNYRGFGAAGGLCPSLCLCYASQLCCGGRVFCC